MKASKHFLFGLLCAMGMSALSANALEYKQVGTASTTTQSCSPVYTMSKYTQGITFYKKDAIAMDAGTNIKSLSFLGYQSSEKDFTGATARVYVANTASTDYTEFLKDGEAEGGNPTTVIDDSKATLFYEGELNILQQGSASAPVDILTFENASAFQYEGENLMVFIEFSTPKAAPYTSFVCAKQSGMIFANNGVYRESGYTNPGYGVNTKKWSEASQAKQVPVMTIGYEAGMTEKQIGTLVTPLTYQNKTCNFPVYTMDKFGQGLTIYSKEALGLDAGTSIGEIGFIGFQETEKNFTDATVKVYLANGSSSTYTDYVVAGEPEGGNATTVIDPAKFTLFYEGPLDIPVGGSAAEPVEILTFRGASNFEYSGENLVVVVEFSVPKANPYTSFATAKQTGTVFKNTGAYRNSGYDREGYGINTKKWSTANSSDQVPVMVVRYGGAAQKISANLSGKIFSGLNNNPVGGATVKLLADGQVFMTTTSASSSGYYEFAVEEVDTKAVYTVEASCQGYETATASADLKAGGNITDVNITMPKLPVPAVLTGYVIDKESRQPMAGIPVSFNGSNTTSAEDGAYSFDIANIDLLPADGVQLQATAPGYLAYSTSLRLTADMQFNIEMQPLPALEGAGSQVGAYTVDDYDYQVPFNTLWKQSVTEVIYPKSLLGNLTEGSQYSSISFYGYMSPRQAPTDPTDPDEGDDDGYGDYYGAPEAPEDYSADITVYMTDTDAEQFTAASTGEDLTALTKLYEGTVVITEGGSKTAPKLLFTADFDVPYTYGGKNVKLIVVASHPDSRLVYFALDPAAKSNVITKYADKDLEAETWRSITAGVPVIKLGDFVPTGVVSGVVTDKYSETPLEGAEVTVSYETERYSATTDADGAYSISLRDVRLDAPYTVTVSFGLYNELTEEASFTADELQRTVNFALTQEGSISGIVFNDKQEPVAGATVTLYSPDATICEKGTTDAGGMYYFYFSEVKYGTYRIVVTAENFNDAETTATLTAENTIEDYADVTLIPVQSGIDAIFADGKTADIYTLDGILLKKAATAADLRDLPAGIYLVGDKKIRK